MVAFLTFSPLTSAVIFTQPGFEDSAISSEIDALVCKDAADLGFDELVTILPVDAEAVSGDPLERVTAYLDTLSSNTGDTLLGVCLPLGLFAEPSLSPEIEKIALSADFLALDMTTEPTDEVSAEQAVSEAVRKISGSFIYYSLRTVFAGHDENIAAAQIKALSPVGFENYMFVTTLPNAIPKTDETESDTSPYDTDAPWNYETDYVPAAPETEPPVETVPDVTEAPFETDQNSEPATDTPAEPQTEAPPVPDETAADTADTQTEAPQTEAPAAESPHSEAPSTEAPSAAEPATESPQTEAPENAPPETASPVTEPAIEAPQDTAAPDTGANETAAQP